MMEKRNALAMTCGLALVLLAGAAAVGADEAPSLDGKTFSVKVSEPGSDEGSDDQLVFVDGTFRSTACDEYGFAAAPYTMSGDGETVTFEADATSETEGTNHWQGEVSGTKVKGTFTWTKPGQEAIEYSFEGEIAP